MEIIIEQLGTTHNVLDRQKFKQSEVTIGRAYSNDLILTDEHVDEAHAHIYQDDLGEWRIEDRNSLNGVKKYKRKSRLQNQPISSGDIFTIGRNKIRVLFGNHPIPATVKIRFSEVFLLWIGRLPVLISLIIGYVLIKGLTIYSVTSSELQWSAIVSNNLQSALMFVGLAVLVYLLSILFKRGGNFLSHLGVLILAFFFSEVLGFLLELLKFNTSSQLDLLTGFLESASGHLVLFLYFWCILYLAFHIPLKRRTIICLALVTVFVGIEWLNRERLEDFFAQTIRADQSLMPPAFLLKSPPQSEQHFEQAFDLFDQAGQDKLQRQQSQQLTDSQ